MRARLVLLDCEQALEAIRMADLREDWRWQWVSVVALLRTVGHVLHKVDSQSSPEMRSAIEHHYKELKATEPEPAIFWGFIEAGRNIVLKEYRFDGYEVNASAVGGTRLGVSSSGRAVVTTTRRSAGHLRAIRAFDSGPFKDREYLDVAREAIEWWHGHLDLVDLTARTP